MAMGLKEYAFAGMLTESVLYGLYLVSFAHCLQALLWIPNVGWRPRRSISVPMLFVTLSLFVLGSLEVVLRFGADFESHFRTIHHVGSVIEVGPPWMNIMKPLVVQLQSSVADAVQVYRCYIVCQKSLLVVALPVLLWIGGVVLTVVLMILEVTLRDGDRVTGGCIQRILPSFWGSVIMLNIYATSVIVYRIWKFDRDYSRTAALDDPEILRMRGPRAKLHNLMRIVVESALMYTLSTCLMLVTVFMGNSVYIAAAAEGQLVGIAFNLILVRVARERDEENQTSKLSSIRFKSFRTAEDRSETGSVAVSASERSISGNAVVSSPSSSVEKSNNYPA